MSNLLKYSWPLDRVNTAFSELSRRCGLAPRPVELPAPPAQLNLKDINILEKWVEGVAGQLEVDATGITTTYNEIDTLVRQSAPALLRLLIEGEWRLLAVLPGRFGGLPGTIRLLGPDLKTYRVGLNEVAGSLKQRLEGPFGAEVDEMLETAGVPERARGQARAGILRERLSALPVKMGWILRLPPGGSLWRTVREAGVLKYLLGLLVIFIINRACWVLSWGCLAAAVLQGQVETGWLALWAILIFCQVPTGGARRWLEGLITVQVGITLKRRLLQGALRLKSDETRHQGAGQLLGRVIESEVLETQALQGSLGVLYSLVEFATAIPVLWAGAVGFNHVLLLGCWLLVGAGLGFRYWRKRLAWTRNRLDMTHSTVEKMVGYQTRLAQEPYHRRHTGEDRDLAAYLTASQGMDNPASWIAVLLYRGWIFSALLLLGGVIIQGQRDLTAIALSLGGILLVYLPLANFSESMLNLGMAGAAWQQVSQLLGAARRKENSGAAGPSLLSRFPELSDPAEIEVKEVEEGIEVKEAEVVGKVAGKPGYAPAVLEARRLNFRYNEQTELILKGCDLRVGRGERLLLEGSSGGGKSTLISLLGGLREAGSGMLLLNGLDRQTLGDPVWRKQVVLAPQFHENYVINQTFAFNLLMGRAWPPREEDLAEAEQVCRELGLGALLERMPAGMQQMVGESGWQLSHGERSRLFVARALLQNSEVLIFDESFAALDPTTARQAVECVLRRAPTLIVIAHP
jgi:ATP-binding cassette subfamily B protein